jgi:hypothetical protein
VNKCERVNRIGSFVNNLAKDFLVQASVCQLCVASSRSLEIDFSVVFSSSSVRLGMVHPLEAHHWIS